MKGFTRKFLVGAAVFSLAAAASAQVLPEDRFDALYHSYDGGGVKITGPSLLARKKVTDKLSVSANYYVDSISSASIDVLSYASPYDEERTEVSVGADYLLGETILTLGYTNSDENDFKAETLFFGIKQEVFGGLTTVSLGFGRGNDEVRQVTDPDFREEVDRRFYRLGVSQVLTKNLLLDVGFETITDEGYLNNPYRQVRYFAPLEPTGFLWQPEVYPNTRTSNALSVGGRLYREQSGNSVYANARIFDDSWGIEAWNAQLGYVLRVGERWVVDLSYRYYSQDGADFYADIFDFLDAQNFLGRDKEISTYENNTFRFDASYKLGTERWSWIDRATVNLSYSLIQFDYEDYRNVLEAGPAGAEPFYSFDADVFQLYFSVWF